MDILGFREQTKIFTQIFRLDVQNVILFIGINQEKINIQKRQNKISDWNKAKSWLREGKKISRPVWKPRTFWVMGIDESIQCNHNNTGILKPAIIHINQTETFDWEVWEEFDGGKVNAIILSTENARKIHKQLFTATPYSKLIKIFGMNVEIDESVKDAIVYYNPVYDIKTLSDKIQGKEGKLLLTDDVKEFIKKLKEAFNNSPLEVDFLGPGQLFEIIDKLAGEKLI